MQILRKSEAVSLGLKKYFTGKHCKQGHLSERYVQKSTCIECLKESRKKRVDQIKEHNRKRYYGMTPEQRIKERERVRLATRKKYWEDPEKYRALAREDIRRNPEKHAARLSKWKSENQEKVKAYRQRPATKEKARFFTSRRRAIKKQAIPSWANLDAIELIYAQCPDGWHVDHIVPLVSKLVCGLHCEANLRHLPAFENMSKNNRHWPDMP
jgi:hypothetical protein